MSVSDFLIHYVFIGVNIKKGVDGIHMTLSREGRPSGEAYVELESEEDLTKAIEKHNDHMGHRYIEGNYFDFGIHNLSMNVKF